VDGDGDGKKLEQPGWREVEISCTGEKIIKKRVENK
jgi:hypothetical protein